MSSAPPLPIILPDLAGGGAQRVMLQVAGGLDRQRFNPHLLVLGGSQAFAHALPPQVPVEIGSAQRVRDGLPWLIRRLRALKPRAAISVMGYLNLSLLASRPLLPRGLALVVREANRMAATEQALPRWLPARSLYRTLYSRAAAVVAPSEVVAAELRAAIPKARVRLILNPVDVVGLRGRALPLQREPGPGLRLVAAGRLTRQKGFDRLIAVMTNLSPDSRLTIFGTGPDRTALQAMIGAAGLTSRITLAGFTDALPAFVAAADVLLLPSRWEGLPNVVLESLALGTPVVASLDANVVEIAASATDGAVVIGEPETDFAALLRRVTPDGTHTTPRPSLLPAAYHGDAVIAEWSILLGELLGGGAAMPRPTSPALAS